MILKFCETCNNGKLISGFVSKVCMRTILRINEEREKEIDEKKSDCEKEGVVIMQVVYSIKARIPPPREGEDDTGWDLWPRNILWAIFTAAEISAKCLRLTRQPSFACRIFSNGCETPFTIKNVLSNYDWFILPTLLVGFILKINVIVIISIFHILNIARVALRLNGTIKLDVNREKTRQLEYLNLMKYLPHSLLVHVRDK